MNTFVTLSALASIACACSGLARAEEEVPLTRAQVVAELNAARSSGELDAIGAEDSGSMRLSALPIKSRLTRAQVVAEMLQAQSRGELTALYGEDSGSALLSSRGGSGSILYAGPNIGTQQDTTQAVNAG